MTSLGDFTLETDYRDILRHEFSQRTQRNSSYSLRAFARDVGISAATLSEVLAGEHNLSRRLAGKVAEALGFKDWQKAIFCDLVEIRCAPSDVRRHAAQERLKSRLARAKNVIKDDAFRLIADWYHFAILELTQLKEFSGDIRWIAQSLKISEVEANGAVNRLLRLGLLSDEGGTLHLTNRRNSTTDDIPSEAIRQFHTQVLTKATAAIKNVPVDQRRVSSVMIAMRAQNIDKVKDLIRDFENRFIDSNQEQAGEKTKDSVYCLSIQCFPVTHTPE